MKNKTILEVHNELINRQISVEQLIREKLDIINQSVTEGSNAFLEVLADEALAQAKELDSKITDAQDDLLFGIPGTLKDNINLINHKTTGGSKSMADYVSVYDAEVVTNLKKTNSVLLAKTNLDEFGFGGTGTFSAFGIVKNPLDNERITGGSSSGSAVSVAIGAANYSIATDTGDSIRRPASFMGVVGYKPSYGVISRYGVLPFCSTLDHVGMFANDVTDIAILMNALAKFDSKDFTSVQLWDKEFVTDIASKTEKLNLLIFDDAVTGLNEELKGKFNTLVDNLSKEHNITHVNFGMDLLNIISPLYKAMAFSEGSTNWQNLSGITFGKKGFEDYNDYVDLMYAVRNSGLGMQIKSRMIVGNWMISVEHFDAIYRKSRKIRHIIIGRAKELMKHYDAFLIPGASTVAFKLADVLAGTVSSNYCDDALQIANFAGLPSITIPFTKNSENLPFGINLTGKKYEDKKVLQVAYQIEQHIKGGKY